MSVAAPPKASVNRSMHRAWRAERGLRSEGRGEKGRYILHGREGRGEGESVETEGTEGTGCGGEGLIECDSSP